MEEIRFLDLTKYQDYTVKGAIIKILVEQFADKNIIDKYEINRKDWIDLAIELGSKGWYAEDGALMIGILGKAIKIYIKES